MIDWEKMASGLLYDANFDPAVLEARDRAQDLCMDYNQLRSTQKAERLALLRSLLAACGEDIVIEPPFFVDYGCNMRVGKAFYALLFWTARPLPSATMYSLAQTAALLRPDTRSILRSATPDWNMPSPSRSAITSGLVWACRYCPA